MKYTIELTNKQKEQMDCMMEIVHRYVGFNPKLEPIKTTNIEDTNEYLIGYKTGYDIAQATKKEWGKAEYDRGFEDGKNEVIHNTELIPELKKTEYTKGYNSAINDYNAMYEWLHDCFEDFEKFLLEKEFYTDEKFSDGFVVGQLMYDLICDHDIADVISEFKKWQEEKKKADEIKVGDVVKFNEKCHNYDHVKSREFLVLHIFDNGLVTILYDNGDTGATEISLLDKTGRHFDQVEQIVSELKD